VLLVLCVAGALVVFDGSDDAFNPGVGFVETNEDTPDATAKPPRANGHPADDGFSWPIYGYSKARTHHLPLRRTPRPPYRQAWARRGSVLLEFSPVLCGRRVYLLKNNGALYAISRATGRVSWKRKLGHLAAASPACHDGTIYAVMLKRTEQEGGGRIIAVRAKTGSTRWSRQLPSRSETSPLIDHGRVYIGSEDGTVYSLRAHDGVVRWRAKAAGAVKGAIALDAGKLYFGDYGGRVHALRRTDGSKVWSTAPGAGALGLGGGNFYIGSTNGRVYSLSSADGKLAWSRSTGGYVYASPAVGQARGGRPTVYIGSYDGRFYALNARTGAPRWIRSLGTKISGAATLIGDTVFVSDLGKRMTWALGARTGKTLWKTHRGAFNPVISDGRRVYFTAYTSLFALDPKGRPFDRAAAKSARSQTRALRAAARKRVQLRAKARALARRERQLKYRFGRHGHRHSSGPHGRSCHRHRHVYELRGKTIVLRHSHCHTHTRARR
jgi:outer membrane protein assembly factor BamB